ncbi:MAG TPA: carboxymuconolactone decarboxylase family protein [Thermomicrobiales bacterium]|nr:carboxymuconolactone decarboxylase family protein [Thermomicrobiales bacterium]
MGTAVGTAQARVENTAFWRMVPATKRAIIALGDSVEGAGLEPELLELVNLRCSQINGCAYCVQYHISNLQELGTAPAKINLVVAWREAGIFSAREEAAFAWAESLTLIAETHVPDADYDAARAVFSEQELASLTAAVATINVWNRFSVAYRFAPEID